MGKSSSSVTEKTGVQFSWHKCRHTYAKTLLRAGVDLETIRIMLGHENLGTTQIYTVLGADEALERMRKKQDVKFVSGTKPSNHEPRLMDSRGLMTSYHHFMGFEHGINHF